ncbi:MAG: peptidylprolyl isomerase [Pseudomonadota bacterium]|nr:peptidylprolyl isomerase [Pseudomonadota bacterium]
MHITANTAVTLVYKILDARTGQLLDSGTTAYLHGGHQNLFLKVEAALEGQGVGHAVNVALEPADAFGEHDAALVTTMAKADFPPGVKVGGQLQGPGPSSAPVLCRAVKIKGSVVHLDGNAPLAGRAIRFAATVKAVRPATAEEIAHGHVHGKHGHQHWLAATG